MIRKPFQKTCVQMAMPKHSILKNLPKSASSNNWSIISNALVYIWLATIDDDADDDEEVALTGSLNQSWSPPSHQSSPGGSLRCLSSLNLKHHPIKLVTLGRVSEEKRQNVSSDTISPLQGCVGYATRSTLQWCATHKLMSRPTQHRRWLIYILNPRTGLNTEDMSLNIS